MSKQFSRQGVIRWTLLILIASAALPLSAQEWQLSTLHSFGIPALSAHNASDLTLGNDGKLYGTCMYGGAGGGGIVFRLDRNASNFESVHNFSNTTNGVEGFAPEAGVILASDGRLYGTTATGGTNYAYFRGALYTLNPDGSDFHVIHQFEVTDSEGDGAGPLDLIEGTDEKLYGITSDGGESQSGTVFRINKDGSSYEVIHEFDGSDQEGGFPIAPLLLARDGMLYGETSGNWDTGPGQGPGTIFKLNTDGTGFQVIHTVNTNEGTAFYWRLTEGRDGALYGTTFVGQMDNGGMIFKVLKDGSGYRVLHEFTLSPKSLSAPDVPFGPLYSDGNGLLYGVTKYGGPGRGLWGTVFSLDENGNSFRVLDSFGSSLSDARFPIGALVPDAEGNFFGESQGGGLAGDGTILRYRRAGRGKILHNLNISDGNGAPPDSRLSGHEILHNFNSSGGDGAYPNSSLVSVNQTTNHLLYGITAQGGVFGQGTVYQMNYDGTGYKLLRSLTDRPVGVVADQTGSNLFVATTGPGLLGQGALYRMEMNGRMKILHRFRKEPNDGIISPPSPFSFQGGFIQGKDGLLYGVTQGSGKSGVEVIYRIGTNGKDFLILHQFDDLDGTPGTLLLEGDDGALYGTTSEFEIAGTAFKINKDGTGFMTLHTFNPNDPGGPQPSGPLLEASDRMLYGATESTLVSYGPPEINSSAVIYQMDTNGGGFTILYTFTNYVSLVTSLAEGDDGLIYGAGFGGFSNGFVFRLQKDGNGFQIIYTFDPFNGTPTLFKSAFFGGGVLGVVTTGDGYNDIGGAFTLAPP